VRFTGEHRDRFGGAEPICRVLTGYGVPIAPSTYYAATGRPASARAVRDEYLKEQVMRVWKENYEVYGAYKVWRRLRREGITAARFTVERLVRELGIAGVWRGRGVRATVPGTDGQRASDLLGRDFTAPAPNRRPVAGFTDVAAWCGIVYVTFAVDICSRAIAGSAGAGAPRRTSAPSSSSMPSRWRCGGATGPGTRPGRAWCTTPIP